MKTTLSVMLLASLVLVGFKIPKNVYRMDQLGAAKSEAQSKNKAITFIYTDEETTCPLCADASLGVMNGLASKTVVVYAYTKTDAGKLPDLVVEAFRRPEMGRYIPFTVVVDAAMTNVIAIVPYARGSEQKKLLKAVNKAIFESSLAAKNTSDSPASQPIVARSAPVTESSGTRELRTWKAKTGFEVKASLVKEIGEYVVLKKEDGTEATVFLCILTDEDQAYVASLRNTQ